MKKALIIVTGCLIMSITSHSQVGINTEKPHLASVLDIVSDNRGILIPRVSLTSSTMHLVGDNTITQPEGLLVYNVGKTLSKGFYYWKEDRWMAVEESSSSEPEIESLHCSETILEPQNFKAGKTYVGIMKVPYTGGNGGKYSQGSDILSTGNEGLTAKLKTGKLEYGNGFLVYDISGIPKYDSPTAAKFEISFRTTKTQNCNVSVGDNVLAETKTHATVGPLLKTSDNGVNGYHRAITTPDGKFSVRVFVPNNIRLSNSDLQIKSNYKEDTSIMWNGHTAFYGNGNYVHGSNSLLFKKTNIWYGGTDGTAKSVSDDSGTAWGNPDVYHISPEVRTYRWTTTNVSDQTMYILTFKMGAPSPNLKANDTNAAQTKAFLKIEQIKSQD